MFEGGILSLAIDLGLRPGFLLGPLQDSLCLDACLGETRIAIDRTGAKTPSDQEEHQGSRDGRGEQCRHCDHQPLLHGSCLLAVPTGSGGNDENARRSGSARSCSPLRLH